MFVCIYNITRCSLGHVWHGAFPARCQLADCVKGWWGGGPRGFVSVLTCFMHSCIIILFYFLLLLFLLVYAFHLHSFSTFAFL